MVQLRHKEDSVTPQFGQQLCLCEVVVLMRLWCVMMGLSDVGLKSRAWYMVGGINSNGIPSCTLGRYSWRKMMGFRLLGESSIVLDLHLRLHLNQNVYGILFLLRQFPSRVKTFDQIGFGSDSALPVTV